jgi:hypothetical protein
MSISDKDWFEASKESPVVLLEHLCNMGIWVPEGEYEAWVELKEGDPIDVASSPEEVSVDSLRNSFKTIIREKLFSIVDTWNTLAEKLRDDEVLDEAPTVELDEVVNFILQNWKVGQVVHAEKESDSE